MRDREKAAELDPRDLDAASDLADLDIALRRYADAERVVDHAIATMPQQSTGPFWRQKSKIALAKGDAKAAAIYAVAYGQNAEFYAFYRSLEAYKASFKSRSDVMVLDPSSEFFKYLKSAGVGKSSK